MLFALGQFVFGLSTVAPQELQRATSWRHPGNSRVGARQARQFLGPGDDTINLSGLVALEFTGGTASIDELREMGDSGSAWPLVDGSGVVYGQFVIGNLHVTGTLFLPNGTPMRTDFNLTLNRVDDARTDAIGDAQASPVNT
jgi:hypothetical protein